jgi:hypothetical protein
MKEFFKAAASKARSLSQFRNKLAHDLMVDKTVTKHFLVHGRSQFQSDEAKQRAMQPRFQLTILGPCIVNLRR